MANDSSAHQLCSRIAGGWVHALSSHLEDFEGVEALWTVLHKVDA